MLCQSLSQLDATYGQDNSTVILDNCSTLVYLPGGMNKKTCSYISEMLNLPLDEIMFMGIGRAVVFRAEKSLSSRKDTTPCPTHYTKSSWTPRGIWVRKAYARHDAARLNGTAIHLVSSLLTKLLIWYIIFTSRTKENYMENLKLTSSRADIPKAQTSILIGNKLSSPNTKPDTNGAVLYGNEGNITMSDDMLSRGTLFLGSTGSGKTNVITMLMDSVLKQLTDDDTVIIFDSKRDFFKRFFSPRNPKHIVVSSSSGDRLISRSWNLFHECFLSGQNPILTDDTYVYVNEMSKALMRNLESPQQPFFNIAAFRIYSEC